MPQSSISPDPVIIVGGGPTGVTFAIELRRRGVSCRVIDKAIGPAITSRSFTLHSRTLEGFARVDEELVARLLENAIRCASMDCHFQGDAEQVARLDFTQLDGPYPFIGILEQNEVERTLRDYLANELGVQVEWQTELASVVEDDNGRLTATLLHRNADGSERAEVVNPRWLVGCDGLRSTVRTQIGLDFEGDEYTGMSMRMMDVELYGFPLSDTAIHYLIRTNRMLLVTKLPSADYYRVLISDMTAGERKPTIDPDAARAEFQAVMDEHFHGRVTLGRPHCPTVFSIWRRISTGYRSRRRTATGYRGGNIFLAGDAGHIHSPAGGQGMNACIQDAMNLAWKLAQVANDHAPESLLDTYERERRPIAEQVIAGTHLLHQVTMDHGESTAKRHAVTTAEGFNLRATRQISGLSYHYRESVVVPPAFTPLDGFQAGDRLPDLALPDRGTGGRRGLHALLQHPGYTLLILQQPQSTVGASVMQAAQVYGDLLRTEVIHFAPGDTDYTNTADDGIHALCDASGADTLCLVRPDGHIGLRCLATEQAAFWSALDRVLIAPVPSIAGGVG